MAELMHRVFISSTCVDLPEHRAQAIAACMDLELFPDCLEHWPAVSADGVEESLRHVDKCDIYLGIFGQRYGYVPDGQDISITEMEYTRAQASSKPIYILIFLTDVSHPFTVKDYEEREDARSKLQALRTKLGKGHTCRFFKNEEDLRIQVTVALARLMIDRLTNELAARDPQIPVTQALPEIEAAPPSNPVISKPTVDAPSSLAVRLLLAAGDGKSWDSIPAVGATRPKGTRVRVMALAEIRCYLLLIVEAFGQDGMSHGFSYFGPRAKVDGSESLVVEPTGIWQSLPSGGVLREKLPDQIASWKMGFLVCRDPPIELLQHLDQHDRQKIEHYLADMPTQGDCVSQGRQEVQGPDLEGTAELVRLEGSESVLHWSEIRFQ